MKFDLILQSEAIAELQEAFEWYEKQKQGLGFLLLEEVENCFEKLSLNPQYYTYINKKYRRIKVKKFPYLIVYEIEKSAVFINSFFHEKRNPKY
ncbi:MAG: type II toxin-antitoxin system RelE/ParE family toxin [Bacteroidota bacterium]|nr:type II toxin-antitoxin system RelE/ParE family toxin [Bacteroidota bacterium]